MIQEHQQIELTTNLIISADERLLTGVRGTVISVYNGGAAYAVEFLRPGLMPAVVTVYPDQFKPV